MIALCRANAWRISSTCSSQSLVEPSMSVKRNVTVPDGRFNFELRAIGRFPCLFRFSSDLSCAHRLEAQKARLILVTKRAQLGVPMKSTSIAPDRVKVVFEAQQGGSLLRSSFDCRTPS